MLSKAELARCREVDISTCDGSELVDLREIEIDTSKAITQRMESFFEQVQNPYVFRVGDIVMKIDYGQDKEFAEAFTDILCRC